MIKLQLITYIIDEKYLLQLFKLKLENINYKTHYYFKNVCCTI